MLSGEREWLSVDNHDHCGIDRVESVIFAVQQLANDS